MACNIEERGYLLSGQVSFFQAGACVYQVFTVYRLSIAITGFTFIIYGSIEINNMSAGSCLVRLPIIMES